MAIEIRRKANGTPILHFYGGYVDHAGRRRIVALKTTFSLNGMPASLRDKGSAEFEAARVRAEEELKNHQEREREQGRVDHLTELLIQSKTGRKVKYAKLADLPDMWRKLGRETKPGEAWFAWCDTVFKRFAEKMPCKCLHEVTPEQAGDYVETLYKTFSRKTAQGAVHLLRSAFRRFLPQGASNPFEIGIKRKGRDSDGGMVHRKPFTAGELAALFEAARQTDRFLYPLVVCAACSGMRRGDVACLKWKSVDLRAGVLAVKTSKTGVDVQIPIFPKLREVLEIALVDRKPDAVYVWPDAARMYKTNPDGLTWRFKKIAVAVIHDPESIQDAPQAEQDAPAIVPLAEILPEVVDAVQAKLDGARRELIIDTLNRYAQGASVREIEKRTGRARSSVSADLHFAENASGLRFMPKQARGSIKDKVSRLTRVDATGRVRRASVADWHSLRTSWITLALAAGVPVELCRLVTGHQTVEIVMRHYFKPQAEHLRAVLGDKLPDVLTGHKARQKQLPEPEADHVAAIAAQLKALPKTDRARLSEMLKA